MSSTSMARAIQVIGAETDEEGYIEWGEVPTEARSRVLDKPAQCLLALGIGAVIAGTISGIWPIALAAVGPFSLALLDTRERRGVRKR